MASRAGVVATVACTMSLGRVTPASMGPVTWDEVVARYATVVDYTANYDKQELAISAGEMQHIRLWFRKPGDVRLEWLDENGKVDQVAVYRQGFNDGKLIARRRGMLGSLIGTVRLDPRDSRALQESRHPMTDVGLGYIVGRLEQDSRLGLISLGRVVEEQVDGQPADRFEFDAPTGASPVGVPGARRVIVRVDRTMRLPADVDVLDAGNKALERHRFRNLHVNVGLADTVFALP